MPPVPGVPVYVTGGVVLVNAANAPAAGVRAPESKLITVRDRLPVTGMPEVKAAARLAVPRPTSS